MTDQTPRTEPTELKKRRTAAAAALANLMDFRDNGKASLDAKQTADLKALIALDVNLILGYMQEESRVYREDSDD